MSELEGMARKALEAAGVASGLDRDGAFAAAWCEAHGLGGLAGYKQKYKIEWFLGSRSMGSVTKNGGESFILRGSSLSSKAFSVTGSYKKNNKWYPSHHKIFPDPDGGIQVRFEDGTCDNSFETSPDLKVIININQN